MTISPIISAYLYRSKLDHGNSRQNTKLVRSLNILRVGHTRLACQVNGAVMPSATGTYRSYSAHFWL